MKRLLQKYLLLIAEIASKIITYASKSSISIFACIFSFCIVFGGIYITSSRNLAIKQIRWQMAHLISQLNEIGIDIAYENIEFNSMFFSPLVKINKFQIYNFNNTNNWILSFDNIKAFPNIFGTSKIRFEASSDGVFSFNDYQTSMSTDRTFLDITKQEHGFKEIVFHSQNINFKDLAKIEKISFLLQALSFKKENSSITIPSFESFFEIKNVKINGLIDYPLSSNINLIYAKSSIMGRFTPEEHLLTTLETWLKEGGFIEVPNLIVQWEPLTLVGRGSINFNENFSPRINFNTSSKGILRLLDDLQKNEFLESKNVFVANILLSNKAFKINPEDEELTISTPIGYSDKKITIENLTIKDFTK